MDILLSRQALVRILVPTDGESRLRFIYGLPGFQSWLQNDLPKLRTGTLKADQSPEEQVDNILYRWITGKPIIYTRQFQDLMPRSDEVWEMKTADIRIFGWMYRPLKFIAVFGEHADLYKGSKGRRPVLSYEDARRRVMIERNSLDLDEPKYVTGTFDELVSV
jgi:hypothetical protein